MGAIAALKQNGRTDVKVYSFNGSGPALQAIKDGTMTATLWLDLKSAGTLLVNAIPEILEKGEAWEPKAVVPDVILVTKDNVDAFIKDHPQN
jgi:ribose transport system substrate-binding protein